MVHPGEDDTGMVDSSQNHWMTIPIFWPKPIPRLFFSDTKFSETKTETFFWNKIFQNRNRCFFPRPNSPKPRLFFRDQIFQNRNCYFLSETKFSKTETDTFFPRPNCLKPKPRLFSETQFSETDIETLQIESAKVSRPRPKPRLLNILDNFWRDLLQIFSSFLFSVFLLIKKKRYSHFPNIFLFFSQNKKD